MNPDAAAKEARAEAATGAFRGPFPDAAAPGRGASGLKPLPAPSSPRFGFTTFGGSGAEAGAVLLEPGCTGGSRRAAAAAACMKAAGAAGTCENAADDGTGKTDPNVVCCLKTVDVGTS